MKNTITCDRKGLHHDLEIFQARCYGCFFGISSTPMQLVTCSEFYLIIICDRKGLHQDFEIFHARCLGRFFFGISSTPMQLVTCSEFSLRIIVK
jgi:hypothetical protein